MKVQPEYEVLSGILNEALEQAQGGKGKERHAYGDEQFEDQLICEIPRRLSVDFNLGQAVKKIYESRRLSLEQARSELLGAINYIAAAIIVKGRE